MTRDKTEPGIITALEDVGCYVLQLSEPGVPDLCVGFRGRWFMLDCRGYSHMAVRIGKGREAQEPFFSTCSEMDLPARIVRCPEEALEAVGYAAEVAA